MADLFDAIDDPRRERLKERGWWPHPLFSGPGWRDPDGELFTETEAFTQLERLEREEGGDAKR